LIRDPVVGTGSETGSDPVSLFLGFALGPGILGGCLSVKVVSREVGRPLRALVWKSWTAWKKGRGR